MRQAEVTAAKTMIERTHDRFDLWPERLIADTGYGSAEMLNWLVNDRGIEPHIPVFDKSKRTDDTFSRDDFVYDHASDTYRCPAGKTLRRYRRQFTVPRIGVMKDNSLRYRASKHDCEPARSSRAAARTLQHERCRAQSTKAHVTWPARSPRPRPTRPRAISGKRSRCCSPTSNVVCVESRQAYQALKLLATHKTDRNDARGLAHLARTGFFKPVHVMSLAAHAVRSLVIARKKLAGQRVTLENQIRGLAVVFGVRLPRALSPAFIGQALRASEGIAGLSAAMRGLVAARAAVLAAVVAIDADIKRMVRASEACRRLMTIPGVGEAAS